MGMSIIGVVNGNGNAAWEWEGMRIKNSFLHTSINNACDFVCGIILSSSVLNFSTMFPDSSSMQRSVPEVQLHTLPGPCSKLVHVCI